MALLYLRLSGVQYCPCNRIALMLTRVAQYEKLSIHNIKVQAMQDVLRSSISSGRVLSGPLGLKSLMRKTIHENMMGLLICIVQKSVGNFYCNNMIL